MPGACRSLIPGYFGRLLGRGREAEERGRWAEGVSRDSAGFSRAACRCPTVAHQVPVGRRLYAMIRLAALAVITRLSAEDLADFPDCCWSHRSPFR